MNKAEFYSLNEKERNIVLDDALELLTLVERNPVGVEEMRIFAEWQFPKWGNDLKSFLTGLYPWYEFNQAKTNTERENVLQKSNTALSLVRFWNKAVNNRVENGNRYND